MNKFLAAVVQMDSQADKEKNLSDVIAFAQEAADRGAKLVMFPESMDYCGTDSLSVAEDVLTGQCFKTVSEAAKKNKIWIHCGSMHEKNEQSPTRPYNTSFVVNPAGEMVAKYRKVHLFDVDVTNGPSVRESDKVAPGSAFVDVDTKEVGHLGLSICYDMRFCEQYRLLALRGANILCVPACFSLVTGKDHWEPILRTRAIENGCYLMAAGQMGIKPVMPTYGKSMIIDPWGNVTARASDHPCVCVAEIDLDYVDSVRKQTYTIFNRRNDLYELKLK